MASPAKLSAIRAGLATAIAAVPDLTAATVWPRKVNPPIAIPFPESRGPRLSGGGLTLYTFSVVLAAGYLGRDLARAQEQLDAWLDDGVVEEAIEADPTLGGACQTVMPVTWSDYGHVEINGVEYLGVRYSVAVYA